MWGEFGGREGEDKVVHLEDDPEEKVENHVEDNVVHREDRLADVAALNEDSMTVPSDNTTKATYSVMFYFTPTFARITTDVDGFIDQVLAETNQGYMNSGVALEAVSFL